MIRKIYYILTAIIVNCAIFSSIIADENKVMSNIKHQDIEKFRAHSEVVKLQNENLKKIDLIEIISHNFGYTSYKKLKKDYWTAYLLVPRRQIVQAQILLQKNKQEINEALRIISNDYYDATQKMLDECIDKINELEFTNDIKSNAEVRKKLHKLKDSFKLANLQFDTAHEAFVNQRYVSSISLYRGVKSYAISILKYLAGPDEQNKIDDKFKIHIVDNRNEIYNKG